MINFFAGLGLAVILVPLLLGFVVIMTLWRAWWLYPAWAWFIVPLGVRPISFWHFTALMYLISVLTLHTDTKKDERPTQWAAVVTIMLVPVIYWLFFRWLHSHI